MRGVGPAEGTKVKSSQHMVGRTGSVMAVCQKRDHTAERKAREKDELP